MKKVIVIALLFIHLFNIGGQLMFYEYLVYQSDKLFDQQIGENHYNIDDLTEIRVPVNIPGATDWKSFEHLNGRVQFKNSAYNYVKIRVTRHAIYLYCIPNYATTHLSNQNIIYARQVSDIPVPKKDHVPFGKINLIAYSYQAIQYKFSTPLFTLMKATFSDHSFIPEPFITGTGQPPDLNVIFS
jgi:hypothetical protein